jgi:hypothetical protein
MALVTGSVARGLADAASDLDVYLYWTHLDVGALVSSARAQGVVGPRVLGIPTATGGFEKYRSGDRLVDVESVTVATLEDVASRLDRHEPMAPLTAKTMAGLRDAIPLRGADQLATWRSRLTFTPEQALVEVAVNLRQFLPPRAIYDVTQARADSISYAARMAAIALAAIGTVAAVNRYALPLQDPKWLPWHLERLAQSRTTSCAECSCRSSGPIVRRWPSSRPRSPRRSTWWRPSFPQLAQTSNALASYWRSRPTNLAGSGSAYGCWLLTDTTSPVMYDE